jgi:hypothetical protein
MPVSVRPLPSSFNSIQDDLSIPFNGVFQGFEPFKWTLFVSLPFTHIPFEDSEIRPAAASNDGRCRRGSDWLLVPRPVTGVERLRADRE